MTVVTITRFYSGFQNVCDKAQVGWHADEPDASAEKYTLPEGYSLVDHPIMGPTIYDPSGKDCEVIVSKGGRVELWSFYNPMDPKIVEIRSV